VGAKLDFLNFLRSQKETFADAFPMISYREETWGYHFEWKGFNYHLTDFIFVQSGSEEDIPHILKIIKDNKNIKLYIPQNININFPELSKQYEIGVYYRKSKKIPSPILTETGVKSFSYRSIDTEFNLKDHINEMSEIEEIPNSEKAEFNRLIGGHMHLFDGEIWSLDSDGAILSNALISKAEIDKNTFQIDIFSTRSKVRKMGHGSALLQSILASRKNNDFVTFVQKTAENTKFLNNFDFQLEISFDVHQ
jgi:hypothetical protein